MFIHTWYENIILHANSYRLNKCTFASLLTKIELSYFLEKICLKLLNICFNWCNGEKFVPFQMNYFLVLLFVSLSFTCMLQGYIYQKIKTYVDKKIWWAPKLTWSALKTKELLKCIVVNIIVSFQHNPFQWKKITLFGEQNTEKNWVKL